MPGLQDAKVLAMSLTNLAKDALHVHVGLFVFFAAALLFRWSLRSWRPWLAVLFVALAGEAWDIADTWGIGGPLRLADNWHDIWNTMLWPTVILLLARWTPVLQRR